MSENMGKLQGFNNKVSRYTFYGNTDAEPEAFMGGSALQHSEHFQSGQRGERIQRRW